MNADPLQRCFVTSVLKLHAEDNIAIVKLPISVGSDFGVNGHAIKALDTVPFGHKIATVPIAKGEPIRKFGQVIGFATESIEPGQWVHTQNVTPGELSLDYAFASEVPPAPEPILDRTFMGIRRPDGRVATRPSRSKFPGAAMACEHAVPDGG